MNHSLIEKAFFLKQIPLFQDLDLDILLAMSDKVDDIEAKRDSYLFKVGQEATHLFFLVSGKVEILDSEEKPIKSLSKKGEMLGDESIFNERDREYSVLCRSDAKFIALSKSHIFALLCENPSVCARLLSLYSLLQNFRNR